MFLASASLAAFSGGAAAFAVCCALIAKWFKAVWRLLQVDFAVDAK